jgi:hypothetical protein
MIGRRSPRHDSPGQSALGNAQHDFEHAFISLSLVDNCYEKMVRVQLLDLFDRGHKFREILYSQPLPVDTTDWRVYHDRSLRHADFESIPCHFLPYRARLRSPQRPADESSDVEPRVSILRKRAAPAIGEIKERHVEHEHSGHVAEAGGRFCAILLPSFVVLFSLFFPKQRSTSRRQATMKQSQGFSLPLSREQSKPLSREQSKLDLTA